jgi:glycosyltransferase involved in cell wall biosynthesis
MKNKPTLSLCMIVKDEERNLQRCLDSAVEIVDQVVIVDTGSTDRTVEIAQSYGAEVYFHPWNCDFSEARNESLKYARGDWILILDADDELDDASAGQIRRIIRETEYDAIGIIIRNIAPPNDIIKYMDDTRFRLFRNGMDFQYEQKVHNQIAPSIHRNGGKVYDSDLMIIHHGYSDNSRRKAYRSLPLIEETLHSDPGNAYMQFKKGETLKAIGKINEAREALLQLFKMDYKALPIEIIDTAYMRLAQIELAQNDYEKALFYSQKSLLLNPQNALSIYLAGIARLFLGEATMAYEIFRYIDENYSEDFFDKSDLTNLMNICSQVSSCRVVQ